MSSTAVPGGDAVDDLVSTIIPVHNRPAMLTEAVTSVLDQTWPYIEVIIVDDGSTDNTAEIAEDLCRRHPERVQLVRQANAGPGAARQRGVDSSRGEFLQFLDSDDLLLCDKFEVQVSGLRSDPEADIAYAKAFVREAGKLAPCPEHGDGQPLRSLFPALLQDRIWKTITPLYRRSAIEKMGAWPRKRQLEDWEFDAQAGAIGLKLHYDDVFVAESRHHEGPRLCHGWRTDDRALRDMASAYIAVCGHARRAGVSREAPEMQRFVRSLFWMARVTGARGLSSEASELLERARSLSTSAGLEMQLFRLTTAVLGWRRSSQWAERLVSLKKEQRA